MKTIIAPGVIVLLAVGLILSVVRNYPSNRNITAMNITSPAFTRLQTIPVPFTCDGENINPPLNFENIPITAKSLAIIVEDPDAPMGTWTHWVVFNIPPTVKEVMQGKPPPGVQGTTSFGKTGYGGPCPPAGTHHYYFRLYALDAVLNLPATADGQALIRSMHGHEIATAQLVGVYTR